MIEILNKKRTQNFSLETQRKWNTRLPNTSLYNLLKTLTNNLSIGELDINFKEEEHFNKFKPDVPKHTNTSLINIETKKNSAFRFFNNEIEELKFSILPELETLQISIFKLNKKSQGKALFSQFFYNALQVAESLSFDKIVNKNTLNHSLYAQSKLGLQPFIENIYNHDAAVSWEKRIQPIEDRFNNLCKNGYIVFKNTEEESFIRNAINGLKTNPKNLWIIADLDNKLTKTPKQNQDWTEYKIAKMEINLGKFLLFDIHVKGFYDLKDPEVIDRINNQLSQKLKNHQAEFVL